MPLELRESGRDVQPPQTPHQHVRTLGLGGFSTVHLLRRASDGKFLAVKILKSEFCINPNIVTRFRSDYEVSRDLDHPNIVRVWDWSTEAYGRPAVTMEYIAGHTLSGMTGALAPNMVHRIATQVILALKHAADRGIAHGDLKPSNIMWIVGAPAPIRILDFGRYTSERQARPMTPAYAAPELRCNQSHQGLGSDLYSLGVTLYELSTGTLPFRSHDPSALLEMHECLPPPRLNYYMEDVPGWLENLVLRLLSKNAADRLHIADALLQGKL